MIALTHVVSSRINQCELTHLQRREIDYTCAVRQHAAYCHALQRLGLQIVELTLNEHLPDSTFVEDTAVVVDEIAVMANMGIASRQPELSGMAEVLAQYRPLAHIQPPATLEGGDVLQLGRTLYVGLSPRTNLAGASSLQEILQPHGYRVQPVSLRNCLHLKSACSGLDPETILVHPDRIDLTVFSDCRIVTVPEDEVEAANVLSVDETLLMHAGFPRTADLVRKLGYSLLTVDISELMKAEAAMTCSSILLS